MLKRTNPATKLIILLLYLTLIFISKTYLDYFIDFIILLIGLFSAKIDIFGLFKSLRYVLFFALVMGIYDIFDMKSGVIVYTILNIDIYSGAVLFFVSLLVRMALIVSSMYLLLQVINNYEFTKGVEYILQPFKIVKLNPTKMSTILSISIRMVPILTQEYQRIQKAQAAKGRDYQNGNIIIKAKALLPTLIPLILNSFKKADDLAIAMDVKRFDAEKKRTSYRPITMKGFDYFTIGVGIFILIIGGIYG